MIKSLKNLLILAVLAAALTILPACSPAATTTAPTSVTTTIPTTAEFTAGTVAILKDGADLATIDVSTLAISEFTASFTKKGGAVEEHIYKATALNTLLESYGASDLAAGVQVVVTAKDGYAATFTLDEIQQADNIFIASQIDGLPIEGSDGKPTAKIVVKGDEFSTRWVNDILSIDIVTG